jgi:hypothetical protein
VNEDAIGTDALTAKPLFSVPAEEEDNYLNSGHTVASWLLTTDHKRIGILYLFSILGFFVIAAMAAALMRFVVVVVLTLLATQAFDPRWLGDDFPPSKALGHENQAT